MPARTKLAQLMSKMEGYGIPHAIPTIRNNPLDLRHSPHSQHPGGPAHKDDIGTIDTIEHGWEDAERQLHIYATEGLTLQKMVYLFAPPSDHNNSAQYLNFVCMGLGMSPDTLVSDALKILVEHV